MPSRPERTISTAFSIVRSGALLRPHEDLDAGLARGLEHGLPLGDGVGKGLLHIDVLAGLAGVNEGGRVLVLAGGDIDRVDILAVQDAAVIERGIGFPAVAHAGESGLGLRHAGLDYVGDGDDPRLRMLGHQAHFARAHGRRSR